MVTTKRDSSAPALAESYLAAALMFMRENKILLVYRSGTGYYDDCYALPGGKCDAGETIFQASTREAHEELGVRVQPEALEFMHVVHRHHESMKNWVLFFFIIRSWEGTLANKEPQKHGELAWFDLDALPEKMLPSHQHAIRAWKNKSLCSSFKQTK